MRHLISCQTRLAITEVYENSQSIDIARPVVKGSKIMSVCNVLLGVYKHKFISGRMVPFVANKYTGTCAWVTHSSGLYKLIINSCALLFRSRSKCVPVTQLHELREGCNNSLFYRSTCHILNSDIQPSRRLFPIQKGLFELVQTK